MDLNEAKTTTAGREVLGWFGAISWLCFMMYGHDTFMVDRTTYHEGGTLIPFLFMLVCALSIILYSWRFGRNPNGLSRVVFFTTPAAIAMTALFALAPEPVGSVLYILSPVLFAPALIRRVYGVMRTSIPGRMGSRLTRYMGGFAAAMFAYVMWILAAPPKEIAFIIPAILSVPAWIGVRRFVTISDERPKARVIVFVKKHIALVVVGAIALIWLNTMNAMIRANFINTGIDGSVVLMLLGFLLPAASFFIYGVLTDRGHEKFAFIGGVTLSIIGMTIAQSPGVVDSILISPLVFTNGLGGAYTGFFVLTIPVFFLIGTKRPVFAAAAGLMSHLVLSASIWISELWVHESFRVLESSLFVSGVISALALLIVANFTTQRFSENALATSLYDQFYAEPSVSMQSESGDPAAGPHDDGLPSHIADSMTEAGFQPREREVASLLIEGYTKGEIAHRLHITAAEVSGYMIVIREKMGGFGSSADQLLDSVSREYKLTMREAQILRGLYEGKTNAKIAEELFISQDTVKFHVRNLMIKLAIEGRAELREWLMSRS